MRDRSSPTPLILMLIFFSSQERYLCLPLQGVHAVVICQAFPLSQSDSMHDDKRNNACCRFFVNVGHRIVRHLHPNPISSGAILILSLGAGVSQSWSHALLPSAPKHGLKPRVQLQRFPLAIGTVGALSPTTGLSMQDAPWSLSGSNAHPPTPMIVARSKPSIASPLQGFCHPLRGRGQLSQGIRGMTHRGRAEYAYDLAANIGTPVYAMQSGRVITAQDIYPDWGGRKSNAKRANYVWIVHRNGYRSAYVHLQQRSRRKARIRPGMWVRTGQLIGYSGNSGWSTGPHLHVEVQKPSRQPKFTKTVPFTISDRCFRSR